MVDRKKKDKGFEHNPFKNLKGLRVSGEQKSPAGRKVQPQKEEIPPPEPIESLSDEALFAQEMARLGVDSQVDETVSAPSEDSEPDVESPAGEAKPATEEGSGQDLFLASLGQMEVVFRDELPESAEEQASPRRMRQLRRGKLLPEAKLDLHGLSREQARNRVRYFLEDSVYHGLKTVLVVTGRGKGSAGEPVLRAEMERYLTLEAKAWVVEWGRAPRQYGGEGALVVFLKGRNGG